MQIQWHNMMNKYLLYICSLFPPPQNRKLEQNNPTPARMKLNSTLDRQQSMYFHGRRYTWWKEALARIWNLLGSKDTKKIWKQALLVPSSGYNLHNLAIVSLQYPVFGYVIVKNRKPMFPGHNPSTTTNESVSLLVPWIQAPRILNCVPIKWT